MTDVVIPIKGLAEAKERLRHVLSPDERAGLVLAMLRDVLTTLRRSDRGDIWLVASDDAVFDLGAGFGARLLRETSPSGYNDAVSLGLGAVPEATSVLILPGDVPLVQPEDIAVLIETPKATGELRIAPDHLGRGTNGLFLSSPNLIQPSFGPNSLHDHEVAGKRAGLPTRQLALPGLAQDIDTPEDLTHLARAPIGGAATDFLQSIRPFEGAA